MHIHSKLYVIEDKLLSRLVQYRFPSDNNYRLSKFKAGAELSAAVE